MEWPKALRFGNYNITITITYSPYFLEYDIRCDYGNSTVSYRTGGWTNQK